MSVQYLQGDFLLEPPKFSKIIFIMVYQTGAPSECMCWSRKSDFVSKRHFHQIYIHHIDCVGGGHHPTILKVVVSRLTIIIETVVEVATTAEKFDYLISLQTHVRVGVRLIMNYIQLHS